MELTDIDEKPTPVGSGGSPVAKNPLCVGTKACLKEAEENLFEDFPKGKMAPDISACADMYGHVCTEKYVKSSVDVQPMRFQSLHFIINKIMNFINASVDKDIGYPQDSALVQTMIFVKNCTSSDDRLKVYKKSIFKSVFQNLGLQGFPFIDNDTKQSLDVPTAGLSNLFIYPFFRVSLTHKRNGNTSTKVYAKITKAVVCDS
ncbi:uncharacterized protein LOC144119801 [Amblyomma americanum]